MGYLSYVKKDEQKIQQGTKKSPFF